ncbi:zf-TFIIB domain-containing protein [Oerskovia jenensis]|uniref:Zn-finger nucleic acid-binding protein n=1 Tax=Oerskovia jenensis TaxID=162169 RepID=A0ABS2LCC6_9CELL|nr:zf-TFIIB domain-containing protein [Oerskovia jenensis]MBM7478075.1 Zn-finger nucleic acid-binding protein [Oerskovia jenensis]
MLCPLDQTVLVMTDRKGVEIDYCPTCRGVWLDRGELDKIIDRSLEAEIAAEVGGPAAAAPHAPTPVQYPPTQQLPVPPQPAPYGYADDRRRDDHRGDDRRRDEYRGDDRYRGPDRGSDPYRGSEQYRSDDPRYRKRKKKESWLEDLFDF